MPVAFDFSHQGHALVTLYANFLCTDWSKLTGEYMRKIYSASWNLFTLTTEADRVLYQLVMFLTVFSTECTKWNSAAIKFVLLGFWLRNTWLRQSWKSISDGMVFVFHLAWCVRGLKSLKRFWPYLIVFTASRMVSLSNYCIWCLFFISNLMKSSVVFAAI